MTTSEEDASRSALRGEVTGLLRRWRRGDDGAFDRLVPLVYDELRRIARSQMRRESGDVTIQATELVHEAYLRLVETRRVDWRDRAHFYGAAAGVMRRVLVDRARRRKAKKRDAGAIRPDSRLGMSEQRAAELLALDRALRELERLDARQSRVVEMRYFGGLTIDETGEVLGVAPATVKRDWTVARAWLRSVLGPPVEA